jgi:hypothetical protein
MGLFRDDDVKQVNPSGKVGEDAALDRRIVASFITRADLDATGGEHGNEEFHVHDKIVAIDANVHVGDRQIAGVISSRTIAAVGGLVSPRSQNLHGVANAGIDLRKLFGSK